MARGMGFQCWVCSSEVQALDGTCRDCNYRREKNKFLEENPRRPRKRPRTVSQLDEDMTLISILGLSNMCRKLIKENP